MTDATGRTPSPGDQLYLRRRRFARECALQFLYQCDLSRQPGCEPPGLDTYWEQLERLDDCLPAAELAAAKPFAERLIRGVLANLAEIDRHLNAVARNWTVERMTTVDRNVLRLAAYELLYCSDIPGVASIDEAIELAKEFGDRDSPRFVNGILDRIYSDRRKAQSQTAEPAPPPLDPSS